MDIIEGLSHDVGLQPGLRAPWSLCETVRADLLATLRAVPPGHWARQPGSGRWSVAQQADHLLKAEVGSSKIVRRLIRGDYRGLTRPPGAALHDSRLDAYPFGPVAAPPALQPEGLGPDEAYEQLAAAHARFFQELQRFAAADADAIAAPDPASDLWFTLAGWVRVQALHEAHHILQIKELAREWRE
jgi:DinB superfamily